LAALRGREAHPRQLIQYRPRVKAHRSGILCEHQAIATIAAMNLAESHVGCETFFNVAR